MKNIKATVEVLSQDEIEMIHKGTLRVLENVGMKVPNDECLDLCEKLGAKVDRSSYVVKIPAAVMENVLAMVKAAKLKDYEDNKITKLSAGISTQVFLVDYKTKSRRYGKLDDVMKGIALVDTLKNFPVNNPVVQPSDIPHNTVDIVTLGKICQYAKKPGDVFVSSTTSAKYIIEIGKVMGRKAWYFLESISPLQYMKKSLDMAMMFVKQGMNIAIGPMVMAGATGPVTLAGMVTLQNAEVLGSLFIVYAMKNQFTGYGAPGHSIDLKTMLCSFGSPNQALIGICVSQMGKYYGLGSGSNSGLTDALMPDFQGGFEKASNAIFSLLAGSTGIGCQGIVGADQGISYEQLVIDNEWIDAYNYVLDGIEVNEETIAAEVIESVGIAGNFIAEEHTAIYMRDNYWKSELFNRDNWDNWTASGSKDIYDRAHDYVETVTKDYKTMNPVVEKTKFDEIDYIVKSAVEELGKET